MNKLPVTGKINGMRLQEVIICKGCFQISKPLIYEIKPNEEGIIIVQCPFCSLIFEWSKQKLEG